MQHLSIPISFFVMFSIEVSRCNMDLKSKLPYCGLLRGKVLDDIRCMYQRARGKFS
jgi:hypothetical protein